MILIPIFFDAIGKEEQMNSYSYRRDIHSTMRALVTDLFNPCFSDQTKLKFWMRWYCIGAIHKTSFAFQHQSSASGIFGERLRLSLGDIFRG